MSEGNTLKKDQIVIEPPFEEKVTETMKTLDKN